MTVFSSRPTVMSVPLSPLSPAEAFALGAAFHQQVVQGLTAHTARDVARNVWALGPLGERAARAIDGYADTRAQAIVKAQRALVALVAGESLPEDGDVTTANAPVTGA
jgi:hypothetical protein